MKKFALVFCLAFFSGSLFAQNAIPDEIPLFDDSFGESPQNMKTTPADNDSNQKSNAENQKLPVPQNTSNPPNSEQSADPNLPRLGRNATPVTNLVVEPIPNLSFGVDLLNKETAKPQIPDKKFHENPTDETKLIRREQSLNITESAGQNKLQHNINGISPTDLQRHDVSLYKIAGIGFGDDTETVYEELTDIGYSLQKVEKAIPPYRTTHYNNICREQYKLTVLSDINTCILELAEKDDLHYVFRETYTRPESRETIQVYYSTPETDNVAYKIIYENKGDTSLNSSRINLAKKFQRRDDFWDLIFKTYGLPDENDKKLWGDENTRYLRAFMQGSAYHAYVIMEDKLIQDKDYNAAQSDFKTLKKPTAFTLTGEEPEEDDEE